jgi:hypothetical protein
VAVAVPAPTRTRADHLASTGARPNSRNGSTYGRGRRTRSTARLTRRRGAGCRLQKSLVAGKPLVFFDNVFAVADAANRDPTSRERRIELIETVEALFRSSGGAPRRSSARLRRKRAFGKEGRRGRSEPIGGVEADCRRKAVAGRTDCGREVDERGISRRVRGAR